MYSANAPVKANEDPMVMKHLTISAVTMCDLCQRSNRASFARSRNSRGRPCPRTLPQEINRREVVPDVNPGGTAGSPSVRHPLPPRDALALWTSTSNISRECLALTRRMSAGATTTKKKSKIKPRVEKGPLHIQFGCRAAGILDVGQHNPRGEHRQLSLSSWTRTSAPVPYETLRKSSAEGPDWSDSQHAIPLCSIVPKIVVRLRRSPATLPTRR